MFMVLCHLLWLCRKQLAEIEVLRMQLKQSNTHRDRLSAEMENLREQYSQQVSCMH